MSLTCRRFNQINIFLARGSSKVVEHSPHRPKVEGSNGSNSGAGDANNRRENSGKKKLKYLFQVKKKD